MLGKRRSSCCVSAISLFLMGGLVLIAMESFGCRAFNNPSDPNANNYIGYETVLNQSIPQLLYPNEGTKPYSPSFRWGNCGKESRYQLQVATHPFFRSDDLAISQEFDTNEVGIIHFEIGKQWESNEFTQKLNALPVGHYWWRVRVLNSNTNGNWGPWSSAQYFEQGLHLKEMMAVKEGEVSRSGFRYSYTPDCCWEREAFWYSNTDESGNSVVDEISVVYNRIDENGLQLQSNEMLYPENLKVEKRIDFTYLRDEAGRVRSRRREVSIEGGSPINPKKLIGEEIYFYKGKSKTIDKIESYQYDEEGRHLNFRSFYEDGLQHETHYYHEIEGQTEELYFYRMEYGEDFPGRPIEAKYFKKDVDGIEVHFNSYLMKYNFPEAPTIVIRPGENLELNVQRERFYELY